MTLTVRGDICLAKKLCYFTTGRSFPDVTNQPDVNKPVIKAHINECTHVVLSLKYQGANLGFQRRKITCANHSFTSEERTQKHAILLLK
jgi:hypothetical protein